VSAPSSCSQYMSGCLSGRKDVYSYNFPEDNKVFKLLGMQFLLHSSPFPLPNGSNIVYAICFLETLQTALTGADLYYWFISGYGDMLRLSSPYASPFDVPIIESVVSLCVQFFFSYRIWVLSMKQTWWLSLVICLVSPSESQMWYC
jgi:hypothetical protein